MNKKVKTDEKTIFVYKIEKTKRGLELLEIEIPDKDYPIINKIDLKNSFAEATYFLKKFFVDKISKMF